MIPGVNIIVGKVSVASINGAGVVWGCSETLAGVLGAEHENFSGSKEHLDWLKTDLHAAKIITVQDYKHTKKTWCKWKYTYTVLKLSVKQVI